MAKELQVLSVKQTVLFSHLGCLVHKEKLVVEFQLCLVMTNVVSISTQ